MIKNNRIRFTLIVLMLVLLFCCVSACQQMLVSRGDPFTFNPGIPGKNMLTNGRPVEAVLYVNTALENPLNARNYILEGNGQEPDTTFFNCVILGYSYLVRHSNGLINLEMTPSLKYILDNSLRYIKPLQEKGIKVLVEVRSGNYDAGEEGIGIGLANMDMAGIDAFVPLLRYLAEHYGINGFDFNDIGGGRTAYPPYTRNLKKTNTAELLYEYLFVDKNGNPLPLTDAEIEDILWHEGGNNLSYLIQRTNETLKDEYVTSYKNGKEDFRDVKVRSPMTHAVNHGNYLLSQIRDIYIVDAYTGEFPKTYTNLHYVINDMPYDISKPHPSFWMEPSLVDEGNTGTLDNRYAPFAIDLRNQLSQDDVELLAGEFLYYDRSDPAYPQVRENPADPNSPLRPIEPGDPGYADKIKQRYGALYFTNLEPISDSPNQSAYMSFFSNIIFGRNVSSSDSVDYRVTW